MSAAGITDYMTTPEAYLAGERISQRKHEYIAGAVFARPEVAIGHVRIAGNIFHQLGNQLRGRTCEVFSSNIKVRIRAGAAEFYYYPDVTVDCSGAQNAELFAEEPRVIFEVLSPDTERIDRGEKLRNYQSLDSLDVYALVDQFHIAVTVYRRTSDGWRMEFYTEQEDVLDLPTIECALPMKAIYERTHLVR